MRIHTDTLTEADLRAALPEGVYANIMRKGSRKRDHAFEVTLFVFDIDALHRRHGNSGGYGSSNEVAATWDEWGIWMDRLYEREPDVVIGWYESYAHFMEVTRQERDRVRQWNKPGSLMVRTRTAPWLNDSEVKA